VAQIALEAVGGFTLKTCSSGAEALRQAGVFNPDLILLDVMMPDMDGPTTLGELRKLPELANTPAMFMTAKVQPQEIEYFKSLGAIDVVPKPFDPMTLSEQIRKIWSAHQS
jgi:CheY-like chemotaxis protein